MCEFHPPRHPNSELKTRTFCFSRRGSRDGLTQEPGNRQRRRTRKRYVLKFIYFSPPSAKFDREPCHTVQSTIPRLQLPLNVPRYNFRIRPFRAPHVAPCACSWLYHAHYSIQFIFHGFARTFVIPSPGLPAPVISKAFGTGLSPGAVGNLRSHMALQPMDLDQDLSGISVFVACKKCRKS